MNRTFTYQIAGAVREFRDFAALHKKTGWFTAAVIFFTWGVLGTRTDIGVDMESIFVSSPMFMTILTGFYQGVRVQMVYPLVLSITTAALTTVRLSKRPVLPAWAALCLGAALSWNQWVNSERLLDTMHQTSVQDITRCQDIYREAQRLVAREGGDIREKSLVFVGTREMDTNATTLKGDVIGCSIFQWDSGGAQGVSDRLGTLMYMLGLLHGPASADQYTIACEKARARAMPDWPLEGSIVPDGDMVIIKLSTPTQ